MRLLVGHVPGHKQESAPSSLSPLRDFERGWILGLPGPSPSHEGWKKGYLGRWAECSQSVLQFVSVLHVLSVKAELVPLCQQRRSKPSLPTAPSSPPPHPRCRPKGALSLLRERWAPVGSEGQAALVDRDAEAERVQRGPGPSLGPHILAGMGLGNGH